MAKSNSRWIVKSTFRVRHNKSGCTGINITHNQDTAVPFLAQLIGVGTRHCRVLACHSGAAGIDIRSNPVAPELILSTIRTRQCRFPTSAILIDFQGIHHRFSRLYIFRILRFFGRVSQHISFIIHQRPSLHNLSSFLPVLGIKNYCMTSIIGKSL